MAHLNTGAGDYDQTVSAYIYREFGKEMKVLLHWHKKLNGWFQFGGHIECDENSWQAIAHELVEESGYKMAQLRVLQPSQPSVATTHSVNLPIPFNINAHGFNANTHFHSDLGFAFLATSDPAQKPLPGESQQLQWFSRVELNALASDQIDTDVLAICVRGFDVAGEWLSIPADHYDQANPTR